MKTNTLLFFDFKSILRIIVFILIISVPFLVEAQTLDYAREVVNTLASDEFKGRGYVENGDQLAADYIRNEFKKFGLSGI